jgi:hypothetical protein
MRGRGFGYGSEYCQSLRHTAAAAPTAPASELQQATCCAPHVLCVCVWRVRQGCVTLAAPTPAPVPSAVSPTSLSSQPLPRAEDEPALAHTSWSLSYHHWVCEGPSYTGPVFLSVKRREGWARSDALTTNLLCVPCAVGPCCPPPHGALVAWAWGCSGWSQGVLEGQACCRGDDVGMVGLGGGGAAGEVAERGRDGLR